MAAGASRFHRWRYWCRATERGVDVIDALKRRNIDFVELLGSTSSTRLAAGRLGDIVSALADPQSSARLANAYLAWRRRRRRNHQR